jgi:hypothetical protein
LKDRERVHPGHHWTLDTLRVYLTQMIRMERRVSYTRFKSMDRAGKLLSADIARRLDALNHAREQADALQRTYLPREVHDKTNEEWVKWRASVETGLSIRLPREVYEKSLDEWYKWRQSVDVVMARSAERRAVIASIVIGSLSLIGVLINTIVRLWGK